MTDLFLFHHAVKYTLLLLIAVATVVNGDQGLQLLQCYKHDWADANSINLTQSQREDCTQFLSDNYSCVKEIMKGEH